MPRTLIHFLFIGGIAFWLDVAIYFLSGGILVFLLGQDAPFFQKILGFFVGVLTTYLYNARITFKSSIGLRRFAAYAATQLTGMAVNLSVFLLFKTMLPALPALGVATMVAAAVNFVGARSVLKG
jgi:putative flippase GtrA